MASSVVLKVVGTSPATTQLSGKDPGLACTHHSNGHSPPSPIAPELTSPLPLEATPLPPSLPSPVTLASLDNGLDDNMFIKMLQQQVGLKDAIDIAKDGQDTNKEVELEDLGQTPDIGLSILLENTKDLSVHISKDSSPPVEVPKVQEAAKTLEKPAEQDIPKVAEISKPSSNQAVPLPIPLTLPAGSSSASQTTATVVATPAPPRTAIPGIEALVSLMQKRPDNSVKVVPVKVLSVDTGKEAVITVQEKHSSSLLASLHNVLQENAPPSSASSGDGGAAAAIAPPPPQTVVAPLPVAPKPVTAVALSTVPKSMEPTGPIASVVATPILSAGVPTSLPTSLAPVAATNPAPAAAVHPAPATAALNSIPAPVVVTSMIPQSLISSMSVSAALASAAVGYGSNVKVSFLKGKEATMDIGGTNANEPSPPSLHANEEMLVDDSDEEDMDIAVAPTSLAVPPAEGDTAVSQAPPTASATARSDSASPYVDDDFAMFVAQEANEVLPVLEQDSLSSSSPTPTPTPSTNDLLTVEGEGVARIQHFGITATCPSIPLSLAEDAPLAPLDMTARNFPKRSKYAHRAAMSAMHPYNRTRGGSAAVAKTLDLIKTVLQPSLNQEVANLCDSYRRIFDMAASNINENTGDTVPSSTLQMLIVKMLEEAKIGYAHGKWEFPSKKLPQNEKITLAKGSPMSTKKQTKTEKEVRVSQSKRQRKGPSDRQNENRPIGWRWGMDKRRLDPLNLRILEATVKEAMFVRGWLCVWINSTHQSQLKRQHPQSKVPQADQWDPDKLNSETDFVLGVNVNKALGHAANRGKVYYLHPELFKYACDGDDKTWLYENKHLPVHGGKAFLMIYSEVEALVKTEDCYKNNQEVCSGVTKLEQFSVPSFMIEKMKNFIRSVQFYFTQEANNSAASSSTATTSTAATATGSCASSNTTPSSTSALPSTTCPVQAKAAMPTAVATPTSTNCAL